MKSIVRSIILGVVVFELILVLLVSINPLAGAYPAQPADAAVVFFSDFGDKRGLDAESARRVSLGVKLYQNRLVKRIIFAGGSRPSRNLSGSILMKDYALRWFEVSKEDLLTETASRDSRGNWKGAQKILTDNDWERAVLVSSPEHLFRIRHAVVSDLVQADFAATKSSFLTRLLQAHYETAAWVSYLLPKSIYDLIIVLIRS